MQDADGPSTGVRNARGEADGDGGPLVRCPGDVLAPPSEYGGGIFDGIEHAREGDDRVERVEAERETGHDPEVAAASP